MIEVETLTTKVEEQKKQFELEVGFICLAQTKIIVYLKTTTAKKQNKIKKHPKLNKQTKKAHLLWRESFQQPVYGNTQIKHGSSRITPGEFCVHEKH